MVPALVTALFGFLLAAGQLFIGYRLRQQDIARDLARLEAGARAADVAKVAADTQAGTTERLDEIHVLVNDRMTATLDRVTALESKLGLSPGEAIPGPQVLTAGNPGPIVTAGPVEQLGAEVVT